MIFNRLNKFNVRGFTLIELMIAILIGLLVVGATLTIYLTTIRGSSNTIKQTRLNQDMAVTLSLMANDIRRAGYWGGAVVGANLTDNPFSDVVVGNANTCITYSYDANAWDFDETPTYDPDVNSAAPEEDEYFGFRLNDGDVEIRVEVDPLPSPGTVPDCDDGTWVDLTDGGEIEVTRLEFILNTDNSVINSVTNNTITAREVSIFIEARMVSDPDITLNVKLDGVGDEVPNDVVKIRNNLVTVTPPPP